MSAANILSYLCRAFRKRGHAATEARAPCRRSPCTASQTFAVFGRLRTGIGAPATMRYCDPGIVPFGRLCNSARSRRGGDPQPIAVADDLADGVAERAQAEGLADDEAVHRDRED
jgi:hypothetical protein